ncbi:MAG TPA: hypothetical protein VH684_27640 [Xanthobacteraceae bacterium]|jgi:hypothetical protein
MRSITTRFLSSLAVTTTLAFFGQASLAQTTSGAHALNPPGSAFQDVGLQEDSGEGARVAAHGPYAQAPRHAPAYTSAEISTLPGYSARPPGMCWERTGGGTQDQSGHWAKCKAH